MFEKDFYDWNIVENYWLLRCDNQAVIHISHDTGYTGRVKHIELSILEIQNVWLSLVVRNTSVDTCNVSYNERFHMRGGPILILEKRVNGRLIHTLLTTPPQRATKQADTFNQL